MKKIIAAFDGINFSKSTLEYAVDIAKASKAHLVGVFLDDIVYHSYKVSDIISEEGGISDEKIKIFNEKDENSRRQSMQVFKESCEHQGLNFSVHRDRNVAVQDLVQESIYCDLLVINRKEDFNIYRNETSSDFMRELLADVQCPVLLVPENYTPVQKVVLLYDGSPSAVYAVKMFSYTLEPFKHVEVEVLSVKSEEESLHLPQNHLMKEFMKRHFPKAKYAILKGLPEETIVNYLQQQKEHVLVVLGAYQRSKISRWFKPSMADVLMPKLDFPLFIAHK